MQAIFNFFAAKKHLFKLLIRPKMTVLVQAKIWSDKSFVTADMFPFR